MAAHRYWRVVALEAYGAGDLELSCFHLLNAAGARVDALATLTASTAPAVGALANLQDDDLTTAARWAALVVPTLALTWDFGGSPVEVAGIRLAGDSNTRFLLIAKLQYSDDASAWNDSITGAGLSWPGVGEYTTSVPGITTLSLSPSAYYRYEESSGSVVTDATTFARHGSYAGGVLPTAPALLGQGSSAFATTTSQYHTAPNAVFSGTGAFSLSFIIRYSTTENTVILERGGNSLSVQVLWPGYLGVVPGVVRGSIQLSCGGTPSYPVVCSNISLADGIPHVVQLIYSPVPSERYCIVDGVDRTARGVVDAAPVADGASWQIGSRAGSIGYGGAIDELAFFSRALSVGEAVGIYNGISTKLSLTLNRVKGRAASIDPLTAGGGPVITYGTPSIEQPTLLTVESGSIKDYVSGVLGTGRGRVKGTVKVEGTPDAPVYRKVRLIRERDGLQVREQWSDPITGVYDFRYVDELQAYTVLSYDHTLNFRAVIADGLSLANGTVELMP